MASVAPAGFQVSLSSSTIDLDGDPMRFAYYGYSLEHPGDGVMAIVQVFKTEPRLRLACVLSEAAYKQLPSGEDPCRSGTAAPVP